jgi:uncharacterized delta-60 repeat protein
MSTRAKTRYRLGVEMLEGRALLAAGALDTTFGGTGTVIGMNGVANAVLVQPADGKVIAAGYSPNSSGASQGALTRYNPDGTPDTSFGSGGRVSTALAANGGMFHGAALQTDGKIVAVGEAYAPTRVNGVSTSKTEFVVARYTASGALDAAFGGTKNKNGTVSNAGEVLISFGSGRDVASALGLETVNGATKIVVAGWTNSVTGHPEVVVARFNLDGSLDTSFGGGTGKVFTVVPNVYTVTQALAIQPDGKIVVAGLSTNTEHAFLARYNINGTLDAAFGSNGVVVASFTPQDDFYAVAIQPDGKIVAAGDGTTTFPGGGEDSRGDVVRFNTDGTLDTTFGGTGMTFYPDAVNGSFYNAVALQSNGEIVAAGQGPNFTATVDRFNPDGSLDTSFGQGGVVLPPVGGVSQYNGVAIQPSDGEIVAAGFTSDTWPNKNFLVARYTSSTTLAASRSSAPSASPTTAVLNPALVAPALDSPDLWDVFTPLAKRRGHP